LLLLTIKDKLNFQLNTLIQISASAFCCDAAEIAALVYLLVDGNFIDLQTLRIRK